MQPTKGSPLRLTHLIQSKLQNSFDFKDLIDRKFNFVLNKLKSISDPLKQSTPSIYPHTHTLTYKHMDT
ncbi:hypothetical protein BpHYR1_005963 [Brachionus plicatilis]|uniref:Uncharacterized protein n=1 Tax=Brachionus plicatilis TaxID=10195 RepID=A0A3M7PKK9_BRAPC|nr:hypothetical protein BpHYR1_005963 [Brachionus plicatilis]